MELKGINLIPSSSYNDLGIFRALQMAAKKRNCMGWIKAKEELKKR